MKLVRDIAERAVLTFAEAFLAVFTFTDVSSLRSAAVAGAAAALAVIKGAIASKVGDAGTAALLPAQEG